jgi:hypothetical protein
MGHQLHPRGLTVAIAVAGVLITGCSGGSAAPPESTPPLSDQGTPTVQTEKDVVEVNGAAVPKGSTHPVQLDERVVTSDVGRARLRVGPLLMSLYSGTDMRLDSWEQPQLKAWLENGQVGVQVSDDPDARVELETRLGVVLRTRQPGTRFWVCQTPATAEKQGTCLVVYEGEVEWEAKGDVQSFTAGYGTFAADGNPAQPARCPSLSSLDEWRQGMEKDQETRPLDALVAASPPCVPDESTTTSSVSETTSATSSATTGSAQQPGTTAKKRPPPTTIGTPPTDGTPAPKSPETTRPTVPDTTPPTVPDTTPPTVPDTTPPTQPDISPPTVPGT